MIQNRYQAQEIGSLLANLQTQSFSGIVYINAEINSQQKKRNRLLAWKNGQIVYGGSNLPSQQEFTQMLGQKLKRESIETAITVATQRTTTQTSIREFLEFFVKMRLFTWEQIESLVHHQIVLTLEQVSPHTG